MNQFSFKVFVLGKCILNIFVQALLSIHILTVLGAIVKVQSANFQKILISKSHLLDSFQASKRVCLNFSELHRQRCLLIRMNYYRTGRKAANNRIITKPGFQFLSNLIIYVYPFHPTCIILFSNC